jgi:hypothetical protein
MIHPPVNVPGWFFSASDDGATIYTQEPYWPSEPSGGTVTTYLHALALTGHGTARLLASAALPGWWSGAVRAGSYAYVPGLDASWTHAGVAAVSLDDMKVTATVAIDGGWAAVLGASGGKLLVATSWPSRAVLVLDLADPSSPALEATAPTQGWVNRVVVEGNVAYVAQGPYGVATVPLAP